MALALASCSAAGEDEPAPAPLSAYLDQVTGATIEQMEARERDRQEYIAQCMAALGFEYVPYLPPIENIESDVPFGSRDFAEAYGYGYLNVPQELAPDRGEVLGPPEDPNWEIQLAMSADELEAYHQALEGAGGLQVWSAGDEPLDPAEAGCQGAANSRTFPDWQADPVYTAAAEHLHLVEFTLLPQDERVASAENEWSRCMADTGWPGLATASAATALALSWEAEARDAETGELTEVGTQRAADERALGLADWDCRDQTGYDTRVAEVRAALQQDYVDDHREELEGLLATWAD